MKYFIKWIKDKRNGSKVYFLVRILTTLIFIMGMGILITMPEVRPSIRIGIVEFGMLIMGIILVWIPNFLNSFCNRIFLWGAFLASPVIAYFLLELFNHQLIWTKLWLVIGLNILILSIILFFALSISNSTKFSITFLFTITFIYGFINRFVYEFRGSPILATDFTSIGTAASVASDFEWKLDYTDFFIGIAFLCVLVFIWRMESFKVFKWKVRSLIGITVVGSAMYLLYTIFSTSYLDDNKLAVNLWNPQRSYRNNGTALTILSSVHYIIVQKPDGYSVKAAKEIMSPYLESNSEEQLEKESQPNIIVVMDEAFSDLQSISDFETNEEILPFWNSMSENTIKGNMYVSILGGNTANTEFEFLTGNSLAFLPLRTMAYQFYVKNITASLTWQLEDSGYTGNLALHPFHASGWNRPKVYPLLGFSDFITEDDFENSLIYRKFISDQSDFEKVIEKYEESQKASEDPFYLFNVTMQNHAGYNKTYDNLPAEVSVTDKTLSYYDPAAVNQYLNLVHLTDSAIKSLVTYFESKEDPTIIVMFGDHQPNLPSLQDQLLDSSDLEGQQEKYKVPFKIWANYDIEEKEIDKISANYLSGVVCEVAGVELTPYQRYLQDLREEVPVITANGYWGADGNYYENSDETSPYWEKVKEYSIVQYNNLKDIDNRVNSFFFAEESQGE